MVLLGYVAFFDPPKETAAAALEALHKAGVATKILTGNNGLVTQKVCRDVGGGADRSHPHRQCLRAPDPIPHEDGGIQSIAKAEDIATVREQLLDWVSASIDASLPETKARMIRLEARQAAVEAVPQALLHIASVTIVSAGDNPIVLCHNTQLTSALEKNENLGTWLGQRGQFDCAGHRLVFRFATTYEPGKTLYEYLAVKLN